jgi:DNA-binding transcriptional ArsR family regulator
VTDAFTALGDGVRRLILEHLGEGEAPAGAIVERLRARGPISQPTVSQHLKVLLAAGLVRVRASGRHRHYSLDPEGIAAAQAWLAGLTDPFRQSLDALETEVVRGRRRRAGTAGEAATRRRGA